jgi:TPP-dependent trihydroxycyclohexane-1,2-dione (THcHDO) dehydratase
LPIGWPGEAYDFDGPLSFMGNDGGGAVGTGPGHTIGAALALKDSGRLTVGVLGDGDYLMGVNALWTASHFDIPVMIVVADNRSYFNDEMHQERVAQMRSRPAQNRWIGQQIDNPRVDLVAMARAQGFDSEAPVSTSEDLASALKRGAEIVANGGRYFIDSMIEPGYADKRPRSTLRWREEIETVKKRFEIGAASHRVNSRRQLANRFCRASSQLSSMLKSASLAAAGVSGLRRFGLRKICSDFCSIWRIRSRVTANFSPSSSSV